VSVSADYSEATEQARVANVPLSHLSLEVGHFYMDDLDRGGLPVREQFARIAPLVSAFTADVRTRYPGARVSTCFLIDDYFRHDTEPEPIITTLLDAAERSGLSIDYLAREAGCYEVPTHRTAAVSGESIKLAEMVAARIVEEPDRGTTGARPPTAESGWLCNGRRSSEDEPVQAMRLEPYRPAEQFGARNHSIFLDVELWRRRTETVDGSTEANTLWSCPFLAAIWQLLRLGMLRHEGAPVAKPVLWQPGSGWPGEWWEMPAVTQLNPKAQPFAAYRALSILPEQYLGIENAVRMIIDHLDLDQEVSEQIIERGAKEKPRVEVPRVVSRRLSHYFLDGS